MSEQPESEINLPNRDSMHIGLSKTGERHLMVYVNGNYIGGLSFAYHQHLTMFTALLERGPLPEIVQVEVAKFRKGSLK